MSHPCVSLLAPPAPQGLALPQDGAPGNQVLAVPLEMPEAQDLVSFDIVPWRLTEQEWLSLSLSPEQQALAYSRAVTSIGVPVVSPALVSHLSQGQVLLVSDPSLSTDHTKHAESTSVTSHQKMGEEAQLQEMASTSSPRANDPSAEKLHTSEKPFACKACSRDFLDRQELLKHQRMHTGHLPFDCDDCGKSFRGVNGLAEHQRIHSGAKPYGCPHCGKLFRRSSELTKHRRIHTGEKPYECSQCGKAFRQSSSLLEHERIHSGERPYACGECSKAFRGPSDLIKHRRIHSGLKPYECDKCGKAFRRSSGLSRHKRIHSGARRCECSECGRVFKRHSALQKHQPSHQE